MVVGVINAGVGNVASMHRVLEKVGASWIYVSTGDRCMACDALILPGVGKCDEGMLALRDADLIDAFNEARL